MHREEEKRYDTRAVRRVERKTRTQNKKQRLAVDKKLKQIRKNLLSLLLLLLLFAEYVVGDIEGARARQYEKSFRAVIMRIRSSDPVNRTDAHRR